MFPIYFEAKFAHQEVVFETFVPLKMAIELLAVVLVVAAIATEAIEVFEWAFVPKFALARDELQAFAIDLVASPIQYSIDQKKRDR